jgi:hypothetical protein
MNLKLLDPQVESSQSKQRELAMETGTQKASLYSFALHPHLCGYSRRSRKLVNPVYDYPPTNKQLRTENRSSRSALSHDQYLL